MGGLDSGFDCWAVVLTYFEYFPSNTYGFEGASWIRVCATGTNDMPLFWLGLRYKRSCLLLALLLNLHIT